MSRFMSTTSRGALARIAMATTAAVLLTLAALATPPAATAQGRVQSAQGIPPGHLPPPGQCRVWYDNTPPGRQPPPVSCVAARSEAARTGGRVIYGDERRGRFERVDRPRRNPYPDARYPATLPDMAWGVMVGRGQRVDAVRDWLGSAEVSVEHEDRRRRGVPDVVTWRDARGSIVQRWFDDTGDGRADRVVIYENGRPARVIR